MQRCKMKASKKFYTTKFTYRFVFYVPENYRAFPEIEVID